MKADTKACEQIDIMYVVWTRFLDAEKMHRMAAALAFQHLRRIPVDATKYSQGSFNICYRVKFKSGPDVLLRLPILGRSMFRHEKHEDEVAVMKHIADNTSIPLPRVLAHGKSTIGPYIILEFVEGKLLVDYLSASQDPKVPTTLNLDLDMTLLCRAYRGMANILLELTKCRFPAIGGLVQSESGDCSVGKRALTLNMNELVGNGNFPPKRLSQHHFPDATSYLVSLADDHLAHLETQRNDAVEDEEDCRKKYIARCLFRQIARKFSKEYNDGPFVLFCDDISPSNVLVNEELQFQAVIDWEFCYSAPIEFSYCSPRWLLLAPPWSWDAGLANYLTNYKSRQKIFLNILREREDELVESGVTLDSPRLSEHMALSLENGNFWFYLAATDSYALDAVYWEFLHPKHYDNIQDMEALLSLLSDDERGNIEAFISKKMQQVKENKLDTHRTVKEMTDA